MNSRPAICALVAPWAPTDIRDAAGYRSGITHCHEEHGPPWTGAWTGLQEFPALLAPSVRSLVSSVQLMPVAPERTYGKEKVYGSIP
jgi:hypothetical protein